MELIEIGPLSFLYQSEHEEIMISKDEGTATVLEGITKDEWEEFALAVITTKA